MPRRSQRRPASRVNKMAERTVAVPQVVAHRVTRMAIAGDTPSKRDRKEFELMVAEKNAAFVESWTAMATQAVLANQALARSVLGSFWARPGLRPSASATTATAQRADLGVLNKGIDPVHRKAVSNAKRLARTKLREWEAQKPRAPACR